MAKHFPKCVNDNDPLNSIRLVESWDCKPSGRLFAQHTQDHGNRQEHKYETKVKQRNLDTQTF